MFNSSKSTKLYFVIIAVIPFIIVKTSLTNNLEFDQINIPLRGFSTITILISFFSSLILICLGITGEYIIRIYDEVRYRPLAIISTKIGFNE